jgi:hypothetical protein
VSVGGEVVEGEANCVLCLFGHLSNAHYKKPSVGEVWQPGQQADSRSVIMKCVINARGLGPFYFLSFHFIENLF